MLKGWRSGRPPLPYSSLSPLPSSLTFNFNFHLQLARQRDEARAKLRTARRAVPTFDRSSRILAFFAVYILAIGTIAATRLSTLGSQLSTRRIAAKRGPNSGRLGEPSLPHNGELIAYRSEPLGTLKRSSSPRFVCFVYFVVPIQPGGEAGLHLRFTFTRAVARKKNPHLGRCGKMERAKRLELSTSTLARWCSTN